jgi:hypothetical protein
MSGFFQVDLDVLRQFLTSLHDADERMHTALEAMKPDEAGSIGPAGSPLGLFGPIGLNQAADRFQHAWHYGMDQISKEIKETTEKVQGAYDAYRALEDDASAAFNQLSSLL